MKLVVAQTIFTLLSLFLCHFNFSADNMYMSEKVGFMHFANNVMNFGQTQKCQLNRQLVGMISI